MSTCLFCVYFICFPLSSGVLHCMSNLFGCNLGIRVKEVTFGLDLTAQFCTYFFVNMHGLGDGSKLQVSWILSLNFRINRGNKGHSRSPKGPLLTNTTLTVLRHCGKYLQMSRLLRTVAMDVIICLSQLFQYYLYAVHAFFTADLVSLVFHM